MTQQNKAQSQWSFHTLSMSTVDVGLDCEKVLRLLAAQQRHSQTDGKAISIALAQHVTLAKKRNYMYLPGDVSMLRIVRRT